MNDPSHLPPFRRSLDGPAACRAKLTRSSRQHGRDPSISRRLSMMERASAPSFARRCHRLTVDPHDMRNEIL